MRPKYYYELSKRLRWRDASCESCRLLRAFKFKRLTTDEWAGTTLKIVWNTNY